MAIDLKDIAEQLNGILRANDFSVMMYDKQGQETVDPREATRFVASHASEDPQLDDWTILAAVRHDFSRSHIEIKSPPLGSGKDFDAMVKLALLLRHSLARPNNLGMRWRKMNDKINLKDETVNNVTESRDISKPFGSTKSSFQKVGNARLIIRHSSTVNEEVRGSRWRRIDRLFVENAAGERMRYPTIHVAGARAMARHVANEGTFHDEIGEAIQGLSRDYASLKSVIREMRGREDLNEQAQQLRLAMETVNNKVRKLSGPRGYTALSTTLTEKNMEFSADAIRETAQGMMEACSCGGNPDMMPAFETAARYMMQEPDPEVGAESQEPAEDAMVPESDEDDLVQIDENIQRLLRLSGI